MRTRELVKAMSRLETELHGFETRFGVKFSDFYEAMMRGDMEAFDALDKHRMAFVEWLALYKTWLGLDETYRQSIEREPAALQIKTNLGPPRLTKRYTSYMMSHMVHHVRRRSKWRAIR